MKTHILVLIFLFFLSGTFCSQAQVAVDEKSVPEVVKTKLGNLFPGVEDVKWQKLDDEYYANFTYEENIVYSAFTNTGRWLVSKTNTKLEDVPRSLQRRLNNDFGQCEIQSIFLHEDKDLTQYIITLNDTVEDMIMLAYFDIAGNFVKKTDEKGNDLDLGLNIDNGTNDGNTNENKQPVHPRELPSSVNSYVIVNYPEYKIKESYFLNNDTYSNTYYLVLGEDLSAKTIELWFDFQGTLIKNTDIVQVNTDDDPDDRNNHNNRKNNDEKQAYPESKVPAKAVEYFKKKEARAEEIRWDTVGTEYCVSYYNPSRDWNSHMFFDKNGNWAKTVVDNEVRDLHPLIQRHLDENYYDYDIYSCEYFTFPDKTKYYLIKIYQKRWLNDPMVYHELTYSRSGRLEKEVLTDFLDPDDQEMQEQRQNELDDLENVLEGDDLNLGDGDMVDGQLIEQKELPSKANKYIKDNYSDYRFLEAMTLDEDGKFMYSVFLKREGFDDRKRVLFDLTGNFIKDEDI